MAQAITGIEVEADNESDGEVEVPEQLLKDYQELNKKLEQAIVKIHRKSLIKLNKINSKKK